MIFIKMSIKKPYNEYASMNYKLAYSTDSSKKIKATHYVCMYGNRVLTTPMSYAECVNYRKILYQMGVEFKNKELLTIKPYKS